MWAKYHFHPNLVFLVYTVKMLFKAKWFLFQGGMEDFSRYLGIKWTFSLICFVFWILSPTGKINLQ